MPITVRKASDIANILTHKIDGNLNEFNISPDDSEFPLLCIFVNENLAYLWFCEVEDHPGFNSKSHMPIVENKEVPFLMWDDISSMSKEFVISIDKAIQAANEFYDTGHRPTCIDWQSLL